MSTVDIVQSIDIASAVNFPDDSRLPDEFIIPEAHRQYYPGIYAINGDNLRVCFSFMADIRMEMKNPKTGETKEMGQGITFPRPTRFSTNQPAKNPLSVNVLVLLVREKTE